MIRFPGALMPALLAWVLPCGAVTINMTYAGTDISLCHCNYVASGMGSFSFADGLATVTAADLKSFQFSVAETSTLGSETIQYGMADVLDAQQGALFHLTVDAGGAPTGFQMYTDYEGTSASIPQQSFNVMGLGANQTVMGICSLCGGSTHGQVFLTGAPVATPEPASWLFSQPAWQACDSHGRNHYRCGAPSPQSKRE